MQQIIYAHQTSQKNACIRPCDINNFTQSLTRKYLHTATERQYSLCGEKISWAPTIAGVSYQFGFTPFPICLKCKSLDHQSFLFFRSSRLEVFCKKGAARNFIKKETLAQVFSCEFCNIFKNTFFHRTPDSSF